MSLQKRRNEPSGGRHAASPPKFVYPLPHKAFLSFSTSSPLFTPGQDLLYLLSPCTLTFIHKNMLLATDLRKSEKRKKQGYYQKSDNDSSPLLAGRIPPQDLEREKALLGSLLLNGEAMYDIADLVSRNSFYAEKHALIYETIETLLLQKEPIDLLTVTTKLREQKMLDQVGGSAYLSDMLGLVGTSANIKYYAAIIRKKELLRKLISASTHIAEISYEEEEELDAILEIAEGEIYSITSKGGGSDKLIPLKDLAEETWARIEKMQEGGGGMRGVPSGFKALDDKLSGFQKSDLIILAARPSVGKTSFALDIARNAAVKSGVPVAFFSLEMGREQLVDRMLAAQSQVDGWKLRTGKLSLESEFERLQQGMHELMQAPLFIDDKAANNIMNMRSVLRRISSERPIGLIIVDYLQLMGTLKQYDNMVNQVTEISRSLKGLAKEFNVPVIALSQLSRAVEARGGTPRLSDLRDSGSIEQDADIVMFIHREDKYGDANEKNNVVQILIEKHRNGPTGMVELMFDDKKASFVSIEKSEFGDFSLPKIAVDF